MTSDAYLSKESRPIVIERSPGHLLPAYAAVAVVALFALSLADFALVSSSWLLLGLALVLCAGGWVFIMRYKNP